MRRWRKNRKRSEVDACYTEMKNQSNSELLQEIERILESGSDKEMDTNKLEAYLAELQKRAPVMEDFDSEAEWAATKEQYPLLFEPDPSVKATRTGNRKGFRAIRTAEVLVAVLLCLMITANAFGYNPVKLFLNWVDGVVFLSNAEPSGNMTLPQDDPSEYNSLAEALEANGISSDICPKWIPSDYTLSVVSTRVSDDVLRVSGMYTSDRGKVWIHITQYEDFENWIGSVERDEGGTESVIGGYTVYIVTNAGQAKAGWLSGQCFFQVIGNLTEDEITKIIESI